MTETSSRLLRALWRWDGQTATAGLLTLAALSVVGCGSSSVNDILPDRRPDYKRTITLDALEVPPDLTSSTIDDSLVVPELGPAGTASFSDYSRERSDGTIVRASLLPQPDQVRMQRDGQKRWLVVDKPPAEVWPTLKQFWEDNGFLLVTESPTTGVMETEWAENRADIPEDPLRTIIAKGLGDNIYSAPTRDKYRARIEPGEQPGSTDIFLTHYGVAEVQRGTAEVVWETRPQDPELEAEMLRRLMVFIGVSDDRVQQLLADRRGTPGQRAVIRQSPDGYTYLYVEEALPKAWKLVGLTLESNNFLVEEADRSRGQYIVRYQEPGEGPDEGLLSSLAFWQDEPGEVPYTIRLESEQRFVTQVVVLDEDGEHSRSETGRNILEALQAGLR